MLASTPCDFLASLELVDGTLSPQQRAHVEACPSCGREIETRHRLRTILRGELTWADDEAPPFPAARPESLRSFAARMSLEDEEGAAICDEVLSGPEAWWQTRLAKLRPLPTAGLVRQLLERMRQTLERSPVAALQITTMAIAMSERLESPPYLRSVIMNLRGQAQRDHAFVLGFSGRLSEALAFAAGAEQAFAEATLAEYELARLDLVRANLHRWLEQFEEASSYAARAASTFLAFGDQQRYVDARISEGAILLDMGETVSALTAFRSVIDSPAIAGQATRVRLVHNLGLCHRELGELDRAEAFFHSAIEGFEALGLETEEVRSRWALATTLTAAERYHESITILREVERDFEKLRLDGDSALVSLELAETLLSAGESVEVPGLCERVLSRFRQSASAEQDSPAIVSLAEAVEQGHFSPSSLRRIRELLSPLPFRRRTHVLAPAVRIQA
jgi:tetratricopeptide (TPR) repeat protein